MPTRREFLQASAAAAGLAFVSSRSAKIFAADTPASRFRLGLQSYTLREFPVEVAVKTAKELGFAHVEFTRAHISEKVPTDKVDAVKALMAEQGLRVSSQGVNEFTSNHAANRALFVLAKRFGNRNIAANPMDDSFDSLEKLVAEFDIRIAIHNHGPKSRFDKIADVLKAIKGRDPRIGACADLGHYIRSGEDPVKAIALLNDRLFGVHLKDYDAPKGNAKGVIIGKGLLDPVAVYKALAKTNFPADGAFSLEYEENPKNPIEDVKACIAAARDAEAKAFG